MAYTKTQEEEDFRFFDDWEYDEITEWLDERGLDHDSPTVCGSCCGFYETEYWVTLTPALVAEFNAFAKDRGIEGKAYGGGIRIDP